MTLQMYNKRTLKCKYAMYFVKYIYKVHLKWFGTTCQCTLVMYLTNVRNVVSMNILLDVHVMYILMHICNVHHQGAICDL